MSVLDTMPENLSYDELKAIYTRYFTSGYINADINNKFALISLVGFLTDQARKKSPSATCYQVLKKVTDGRGVPDSILSRLSIVCEDFMYGVTKFNTCGCTSAKQMVEQINLIINEWLPF